jgi:hypothetical protein
MISVKLPFGGPMMHLFEIQQMPTHLQIHQMTIWSQPQEGLQKCGQQRVWDVCHAVDDEPLSSE